MTNEYGFEIPLVSEEECKLQERIEELENKIADIKANCDLAIEGRDIKIKELEKENADLKSENQKWKDEWQEQVQKATDEGYARTLQTMQLTKAKELLQFVSEYEDMTCYADELEEIKQFLKEVEKGMTENSNVPECPSIKIGCDKMYYVDEVEK